MCNKNTQSSGEKKKNQQDRGSEIQSHAKKERKKNWMLGEGGMEKEMEMWVDVMGFGSKQATGVASMRVWVGVLFVARAR